MRTKNFVFDTNSLISAGLIMTSVNAQALDRVFQIGKLVISDATFTELTDVLFRPKFDKYFTDERRFDILTRIEQDSIRFEIEEALKICRDPKDDKYLELALMSKASCIITGDKDLLVLHPFHGIPILSASDFLKYF